MLTLLTVVLAVELGLGALEYRRAWVAGARIRSAHRIARGHVRGHVRGRA